MYSLATTVRVGRGLGTLLSYFVPLAKGIIAYNGSCKWLGRIKTVDGKCFVSSSARAFAAPYSASPQKGVHGVPNAMATELRLMQTPLKRLPG